MGEEVSDGSLLDQYGLNDTNAIIWDIKTSSESSIDLGQTSGRENSECSDVGEEPPEEADNFVLSDDDSVCDEGPGLDLEEELTASWDPGSTVGEWYPKGQPMNESSQVLVLNVYLALKMLPLPLVKDIVTVLGRADARNVPWALRAAAGLLSLSPSRIFRTVTQVKQNGWRPVERQKCAAPEQSSGDRKGADDTKGQQQTRALMTLARAALGTRAAHAPASEYVKHISGLAVEGVDVGQKYHTREHFKDVEFLGARCLQSHHAQDIQRPLGVVSGSEAILRS